MVEINLTLHTAILFEAIFLALIGLYIDDFSTGSLSSCETKVFFLLCFCFVVNLIFIIYLCMREMGV